MYVDHRITKTGVGHYRTLLQHMRRTNVDLSYAWTPGWGKGSWYKSMYVKSSEACL